MRKPIIYVPQMPATFDKASGLWVPKISIDQAKRFGDVLEILPPGANRSAVGQLAIVMREKLRDAQPGDFLLPTGDPALISLASIYLSRRLDGKLRLLKWDNRLTDYIPMEIDL